MPITTIMLRGAALAALLTCAAPLAVQAAGPVRYVIRHASQLGDDKNLKLLKEHYIAASTANVVYAQCTEEYAITAAQQAFLTKHFNDVSAEYLKAFDDVFQARTGTTSPKKMLEDYVTTMRDTQQTAVDSIARVIETKGCTQLRLQKIIKYYKDLQTKEEEALQTVTEETPAPAAAITEPVTPVATQPSLPATPPTPTTH